MRAISVTREGDQVEFRADDIHLNVAWLPELELSFEREHALSFKDEIRRQISVMLVQSGLTDEEVAEALLQFKNLQPE